MGNTKRFETERLILRKATIDDAEDIFNNYASREKVTEYLSWLPHNSLEDTKSFLANVVLPDYDQKFCWYIELKENHQVIGCIDLVKIFHTDNQGRRCAEIGWVLSDDYWGKGIMPEAGRVVMKHLKDLDFAVLTARHNVANPKSGRVMQKLGFKFEGIARKGGLDNKGNLVDIAHYSFVFDEDELL